MKIRLNFVSNSSSSSSIIVSDKGTDWTDNIVRAYHHYELEMEPLKIPNTSGKREFGWEHEKSHDFESKLNFCAIQLLYLKEWKLDTNHAYECKLAEKFDEWYEMLKTVCKDKFHLEVELDEDLLEEHIDETSGNKWWSLNFDYYVDHQSASFEGSCMEMFDSYDTLYEFLAYDSSYVETSNDNE